MVDVVDDQMVRGVHDFVVHFDALAVFLSNGIAILIRTFGEPSILAQAGVVFGINDGKARTGHVCMNQSSTVKTTRW